MFWISVSESYLAFVHSLDIFEQRLHTNLIEESHFQSDLDLRLNKIQLISVLIDWNEKSEKMPRSFGLL